MLDYDVDLFKKLMNDPKAYAAWQSMPKKPDLYMIALAVRQNTKFTIDVATGELTIRGSPKKPKDPDATPKAFSKPVQQFRKTPAKPAVPAPKIADVVPLKRVVPGPKIAAVVPLKPVLPAPKIAAVAPLKRVGPAPKIRAVVLPSRRSARAQRRFTAYSPPIVEPRKRQKRPVPASSESVPAFKHPRNTSGQIVDVEEKLKDLDEDPQNAAEADISKTVVAVQKRQQSPVFRVIPAPLKSIPASTHQRKCRSQIKEIEKEQKAPVDNSQKAADNPKVFNNTPAKPACKDIGEPCLPDVPNLECLKRCTDKDVFFLRGESLRTAANQIRQYSMSSVLREVLNSPDSYADQIHVIIGQKDLLKLPPSVKNVKLGDRPLISISHQFSDDEFNRENAKLIWTLHQLFQRDKRNDNDVIRVMRSLAKAPDGTRSVNQMKKTLAEFEYGIDDLDPKFLRAVVKCEPKLSPNFMYFGRLNKDKVFERIIDPCFVAYYKWLDPTEGLGITWPVILPPKKKLTNEEVVAQHPNITRAMFDKAFQKANRDVSKTAKELGVSEEVVFAFAETSVKYVANLAKFNALRELVRQQA